MDERYTVLEILLETNGSCCLLALLFKDSGTVLEFEHRDANVRDIGRCNILQRVQNSQKSVFI